MKLKWILQFLILISFLLLGEIIVNLFAIPLPGSVTGMILLFIFLLTGLIKLEWVEKVSSFQLKHLTLLFIPPIASLFVSTSFFEVLQWNIFVILLLSSISCLLGTAITVEWVEKRIRRNTK